MLDHTDYTILIYDDEQESPKYFKAMLVEFMEKQTILVTTFDELTDFINDLQLKIKVSNEVEKRCQMFH